MDFSDFLGDLTDEALRQAVEAGGEVSLQDRIGGGGEGFPYYTVVGAGSADALVEIDDPRNPGEKLKVSRAGEFKYVRDGGDTIIYLRELCPVVIIDARVSQVCFGDDNRVQCRGVSTSGLSQPAAYNSNFWQVGQPCEGCGMYQFRKDGTHPITGEVVVKEGKCKAGLDLFIWNPGEDPEGTDIRRIQFSSMSISVWRQYARQIESKKAKMWSLWFGLRTRETPADGQRSAYYTPEFKLGGVLEPDYIKVADRLRQEVLNGFRGLFVPASDIRTLPTHPHANALPAGTQSAPPVPTGPDPFENE